MSDDLKILGVDGIRRSYDEHYDTMMDVEQDPTGAWQAIQKQADRIEELEAKLARAVEALERIEDASKYFGNCPEASETTVRYAHETTHRLCRTTLAALKGQEDD